MHASNREKGESESQCKCLIRKMKFGKKNRWKQSEEVERIRKREQGSDASVCSRPWVGEDELTYTPHRQTTLTSLSLLFICVLHTRASHLLYDVVLSTCVTQSPRTRDTFTFRFLLPTAVCVGVVTPAVTTSFFFFLFYFFWFGIQFRWRTWPFHCHNRCFEKCFIAESKFTQITLFVC